ncbi:MAG TPA: GldG family protein, partial [Polyangiaceae bacterium]|nr:GldG family protein [Polyangiaceae bacterium]
MSDTSRNHRSDDGVVTRSTKAVSALGVLAAMAIALLVNIVSARHYARWDFTTAKLYTLSHATLSTVRGLEQNVDVQVLLSASDPLYGSVKNLLEVIRSNTTRLSVTFVDPDRYPAEFVAIQQKYDIVAGRSEDGRVVTDAAIIVASRDRHWFITAEDLVDFSEVDDGRTKSKLEQSITGGIRAVLGGKRSRICFTSGHGEYSLDDSSGQGLGEFRDRLQKNNYDAETIDTTRSDPAKALEACDAVVVAGPSTAFSQTESDALMARMRAGMSGFFLLNPIFDTERKTQLPTGLESVTRLFGIGLANDFVFELDDDSRVPRGTGEIFFPSLEAHATTEGLVGLSMAVTGLRVVAIRSRSLDVVGDGVRPVTILKTSERAFGMKNFHAWAEKGGEPTPTVDDRRGPL